MHLIRSFFEKALNKKGLNLIHDNDVPFGVDWTLDIAALRETERTRFVALDVGANTGQTLQALANRFHNRQIFCFEPVKNTFAALQTKAAGYEGVEVFHTAMSDKVGTIEMLAEGTSGLNRVLEADVPGGSQQRIETVHATTVDQFLAERQLSRIGLLKIDVEGYEMNVLRGAQRAIASRSIDFILCECEFQDRPGEPHGDFFEIFSHLTQQGLRLVSVYTGGVDQNGWRFGDVLFRLEQSENGAFMNAPRSILAKR
ncbi:MAG: FkbM family methyltransferase [Pseudophaeobacter sp. bin_em_oilr2.035]|uniref:FkbM family methyltransferase n=1 Tax=Phaeobacter gallaeciensis TaxID=60890 RepID=A0ABD4XC22_9RHOB|nr:MULTISPECIES: FkbM family methyltransferase [Phaeobacter]MDF1774106.1 FkbM family methyltransferase [Pseudophaeobacter sp. bin_em_oilr2.035]MDE4145973.1 FkbM family methyltransferase [Phaeobacter gallaeciensis]MDE4158646.1 FkbM family methyltransferase [Phaeobacter gallaeciensis]MDE4162823.1 FkbM family methyltransferase [Phaeobacter gallaeciensis]MDE4167051.1 FkbM family methyltransferase [Phaeobacter gallaeciensis]